jgi:hypothetical protein
LAQTLRFKAAVIMSKGIDECREGKISAASQTFKDALAIDIGLEIDSADWDLLCWAGVLHNHAAEVLYASETATRLNPDWPIYRDTRGLARALTGDLRGAIEDFEFVVKELHGQGTFRSKHKTLRQEDAELRQEWLEALRLGQNPLTPEVLKLLRKDARLE